MSAVLQGICFCLIGGGHIGVTHAVVKSEGDLAANIKVGGSHAGNHSFRVQLCTLKNPSNIILGEAGLIRRIGKCWVSNVQSRIQHSNGHTCAMTCFKPALASCSSGS